MFLLSTQIKSTAIDVAICIILFIFMVVGCKKGFLSQIIGLIAGVASILLAYFFCDDLLKLVLNKFNALTALTDKLTSLFSKNSVLAAEFNPETFKTNLENLHIPNFIINAVAKASEGVENTSLAAILAGVVAKYLLLIACFVLIFIICKIAFWIIKKIAAIFHKTVIIGSIDKILGLLLGTIKGLLVIYFVLFVINTLAPVSVGFSQAIANSKIVNFISKYNIFVYLFNYLTK